VTGLLRTADAVGDISGAELGASFTGYLIAYGVMLLAYVVVLAHLAGDGAGKSAATGAPA
jgi:cytochrome d ubiquinol oxidase subunit I